MDQGGRSLLSWHEVTTATTTSALHGSVFTWQLALTKNVSAPRHVFVALQNINRSQGDELQERSHMIFDKWDVTEVSLRISNQQEPAENLIFDCSDNRIGRVYHRLWSFMGRDQNVDTGLQISQLDFQNLYPIYYFSLQHLDLSKHSVVDVKFQARICTLSVENFIAAGRDFKAIAVMLSDTSMIPEGGGGRKRVVDAPV